MKLLFHGDMEFRVPHLLPEIRIMLLNQKFLIFKCGESMKETVFKESPFGFPADLMINIYIVLTYKYLKHKNFH